jgi:serine/threonine-protein kinase
MPVSTEAFELVLIETDGSTTALPLPAGPAFIGSSSKCSVLIADASVAPVHAELLTSSDGAVWIRDLAKRNDTFVNGLPIKTSKLEDGAFIKLGLVDLCLRAKGKDSGQHGTMIRQSAAAVPALSPPRPRTSSASNPAKRPSPSGLNPRPAPPQSSPSGLNMKAPQKSSPSGLNMRPGSPPAERTDEQPALDPDQDEDGGSSTRLGHEVIGPNVIIADRYRVLSKIAEGGMGEVYKAVHIELDKPVALKVMKQALGEDAGFAERFKREAVAASRIGQQNICDVSDFGRTGTGRFFFVMEFLDGQTLGALIRDRGALPISRAIFVMNQLCHALAAAHSQGIVHRDLKPENVMLLQRPGQRDFVKVLDFGVAKVRLGGDSVGTQVGMVVGTPQYMAPEQASGLLTDARTDVYALGLIFYEMLQGKPTFSDDTPGLLMAAQIYREPPPLQFSSGDPMPDHLQELVHRMLAKPPEKRPQTMEEVLVGLEECSAKLAAPIAAMATPAMTPPVRPSRAGQAPLVISPAPTASQYAAPAVDQPLDAAELSATRPGSKKWLLAVGLLLLVGGGLGIGFAVTRKSTPPTIVDVTPPPEKPQPQIEVIKPVEVVKPVEVAKPVDPAARPPESVKLSLTTTPPGATVTQADAVIGKTPLQFSWEKGKKGAFVLTLQGFAPETRNLAPQADLELEVALKKEEPGTGKGKRPPKGKKELELHDDPYGNQVQDLQENPY